MSEIDRTIREMHAAGANSGWVSDLRDMWKRAACAALSVIVTRNGAAPMGPYAQDYAYSAANAADALVKEFRKRFVVGDDPGPGEAFSQPQPERFRETVHVGETFRETVHVGETLVEGISYRWSETGLIIVDPRPGRRPHTITWETIEQMRARFSGWAR